MSQTETALNRKECIAPSICDDANGRSLFFTPDRQQSMMSITCPYELSVDYTQTMMGFAMLNRHPKHIGMIGLGGGSLAKFCYKHFPESKISVSEINPHVIAVRQKFAIPDDDHRFEVLQVDGSEFVRTSKGTMDVLLVDGFDHIGQSPQLCTQLFYSDCHKALSDRGLMVVNLDEKDGFYKTIFSRIETVFASSVVEIQANDYGNVIVFAAKRRNIQLENLRNRMDRFYSELNQW
jgi:spermidine synthase